jgi:hypothetical protein
MNKVLDAFAAVCASTVWLVLMAWAGIPRDLAIPVVTAAAFLGNLTGGALIELAIWIWCAGYTALALAGLVKPVAEVAA